MPDEKVERDSLMKKTVRELAEAVGGTIDGDATIEVQGVSSPERAGLRDLIYVEAEKHASRAPASAAACTWPGSEP